MKNFGLGVCQYGSSFSVVTSWATLCELYLQVCIIMALLSKLKYIMNVKRNIFPGMHYILNK